MKFSEFSELKRIFIALDIEYEKTKASGNERLLQTIDTAIRFVADAIEEADKEFVKADDRIKVLPEPLWKTKLNKILSEADDFNKKPLKCTRLGMTSNNCPTFKNGECTNTVLCDPEKDFEVPDANVAEFILGKGVAAFSVFKYPESDEAKEIMVLMEKEIEKRNLTWDKDEWNKRLEETWENK